MKDKNIQKKYTNLKVIVTSLVLVVVGSLSYIYQLKEEKKSIQEKIIITTDKKSETLIELVKLNNAFAKISTNDSLIALELSNKGQEFVNLMEQINYTEETKIDFKFYNNIINTSYTKLEDIKKRIEVKKNRAIAIAKELERQNNISNNKIDNKNKKTKEIVVIDNIKPSAIVVKPIESPKNDIKAPKNEEVKPKIIAASISEKLYKIGIKNLKAELFKLKIPNKPETTSSAKEVEMIKISFTIPQNFVVRASQRTYYIQVLDENKKFVGEKGIATFEDSSKLTYNLKTIANYKNKNLTITEDFYYKNFKKGTYIINVFDKNELVSKTVFTLI